ncbi:hypothetical protein MGG_16638 [Pyricularia oryzae 70-15]|uniref:Uncharacterized protein n=1 Tax=Pyricularia oryzae (strain 70-15 / ATCC MYA-4617 / FGSC 8958) TaxID=242507 RepID=G4N165_PYRO7|nr:uncharacterized protein MGG_16638 [Pyricularia oryzae 70-15]EHA51544.1 hypothetical protein MGG_16638 [Pyricularia oryzae 70-15]
MNKHDNQKKTWGRISLPIYIKGHLLPTAYTSTIRLGGQRTENPRQGLCSESASRQGKPGERGRFHPKSDQSKRMVYRERKEVRSGLTLCGRERWQMASAERVLTSLLWVQPSPTLPRRPGAYSTPCRNSRGDFADKRA